MQRFVRYAEQLLSNEGGDPLAHRLLTRLYTAAERHYAQSFGLVRAAQALAVRFAAREAALKAASSAGLAVKLKRPPRLSDFSVVRADNQAPQLIVSPDYQTQTAQWSLATSHTDLYAVASVIYRA